MNPTTPAILVVDDDVDTCVNLSDILSDLGYQVDTAHDGPAALELVRRSPYDVALLDFRMPGMDGLTLYRHIRQLRPETVAMIITAYHQAGMAEEAYAAGAWQVLPKPVDFPRVLQLLQEALGQPLVLVVDDDPDLCDTLWDLLREHGYRVALAHNLRTAADRLDNATFEVVLIDMKLPEGDGSQVFRRVRQANPEAGTVLITGYRAETAQAIQQLLADGANAVCYKPFDVGQLLATVAQLSCG